MAHLLPPRKPRNTLKQWLEQNKIFFEVFSMMFLGVMAVIVSVTQLRISEYEIELHKKEVMPIFDIFYSVKHDKGTPTLYVEFHSSGTPVRDFKCETKSIFEFNIYSRKTYKYNKIYYGVPLSRVMETTGKKTGLILKEELYINYECKCIEDSLNHILNGEGLEVFISPQVYNHITFKNLFDEEITKYYMGSNEIETTRYSNIAKQAESKVLSVQGCDVMLGEYLLDDIRKAAAQK